MYHEISPKNPDELFNTNMIIDLNDKLHQDKEDKMFQKEILNNYDARILLNLVGNDVVMTSSWRNKMGLSLNS